MKLPAGVRKTLDLMDVPFAKKRSKVDDGMPLSLLWMHRAMKIIFGVVILSVFVFIGLEFWKLFLLAASLAFFYVGLFLKTQKFPDMLVVKKMGDPVWVYENPAWRFFFKPVWSVEEIDGNIIDVDLEDVPVSAIFNEQPIESTVSMFASIRILRSKEAAIASLYLRGEKQRWEYFRTEMIDKVSTIIGTYSSPIEVVSKQKEIEREAKTLLNIEYEKMGYEVIDHNLYIKPRNVAIDAGTVKIMGKARAEVTKLTTEAIGDSLPATILPSVFAVADTVREIFTGKKGSKKEARNLTKSAEKIIEASEKLSG